MLFRSALIKTARNTLSTDPWLVLDPVALSIAIGQDLSKNFSVDDAVVRSIDNLQGFLGDLGPGFDGAITGLIWSAGVMGWKDGGALNFAKNPDGSLKLDKQGNPIPLSIVTDKQDRLDDFSARAGVENSDLVPDSLDSLLLSMGQIDALGNHDEGVIRVIRSGTPPVFTVIIPSTQEWAPWGTVPNDIIDRKSTRLNSSHWE